MRWYDLDLTFNPAGSQISGTVRTQASVVTGPLTTMDLDLDLEPGRERGDLGRHPDVVLARGRPAHREPLTASILNGELLDVRVTYTGSPVAGSFGFQIVNGRQLIWSLSEPYGARTWWPCKDIPEDKADSVTIRYTVPTGLTTASNGTLRLVDRQRPRRP